MMRRRPRPATRLTAALWVNAALLATIAAALVAKPSGSAGPSFPAVLPAAMAQPQPIAGGAGLFLMPAQFSRYAWGCYIMDVDAQTLAAYKFDPAATQLQLVAARDFRYDRRLTNFNAGQPTPQDVRKIVETADDPAANQAPPGVTRNSPTGGGDRGE